MSKNWADRQRETNKLVRKIAEYVFSKDSISAQQLYGLSKLTWITNSYEGQNAKYVKSTKIPALEAIFSENYNKKDIEIIAGNISELAKEPSLYSQILKDTGFTNFYKAYRNSVSKWLDNNFDLLLPMYKSALLAKNSEDRREIIAQIMQVPGIPKANHPNELMKAEFFLTPVFFALDKEVMFPLINGNKSVKSLLKKLKVQGSSLLQQYDAMISLYGVGGIKDAADLDQIGADIPNFISTSKNKAKVKLLEEKDTNSESPLSLKDESDVEVIKLAGKTKQRRIHNQLTNKVLANLTNYTLLEGNHSSCMFDILVKNYNNKKDDLIIEVKSSIEQPNIRMAIGQLFDYWYELNNNKKPHIAILLPDKPTSRTLQFLEWMGIGILWFEEDNLCTYSSWLKIITNTNTE